MAKRKAKARASVLPMPSAIAEVWLAGLGALGRAQREGRQWFDALVRQGQSLEVELRRLANAQLGQASRAASTAAQQASDRAMAAWADLNKAFQAQIERVTATVGVPKGADLNDFAKRVQAFAASMRSIAPWQRVGFAMPGAGAKNAAKRKSVKRKARTPSGAATQSRAGARRRSAAKKRR
jgi:poly(hydroxyalkanoate) granule-associated protein